MPYPAISASALILLLLLSACEGSGPRYTNLRIYSSPYSSVNWDTDRRLLAQHHDHLFNRPDRILAYDRAGYQVVSFMDYSGNPALPFALRTRPWPYDDWIPGSVLTQINSIELFIPNAEEVGLEQHVTSPFLTTYIEVSSDQFASAGSQYRSLSEMFSLITSLDGRPCIAHPWSNSYAGLPGIHCAEIYSAFAEARRRSGEPDFNRTNRNEALLRHWDSALVHDQRIVGIAVNDHFGPYANVDADIADSGKIVVLAASATLAAYRAAFEAGAVLAVADRGATKGDFPQVFSIVTDDEGVEINTDGSVRWIVHGQEVLNSPRLLNKDLPPDSQYVRAEIHGNDESTVYTQAFVVRPVGDVDGDYDTDNDDKAICASDRITEPVIAAACVSLE